MHKYINKYIHRNVLQVYVPNICVYIIYSYDDNVLHMKLIKFDFKSSSFEYFRFYICSAIIAVSIFYT